MERGQGRYIRFSMSEATTFCNGNPSEIALRASLPTARKEENSQLSHRWTHLTEKSVITNSNKHTPGKLLQDFPFQSSASPGIYSQAQCSIFEDLVR